METVRDATHCFESERDDICRACGNHKDSLRRRGASYTRRQVVQPRKRLRALIERNCDIAFRRERIVQLADDLLLFRGLTLAAWEKVATLQVIASPRALTEVSSEAGECSCSWEAVGQRDWSLRVILRHDDRLMCQAPRRAGSPFGRELPTI